MSDFSPCLVSDFKLIYLFQSTWLALNMNHYLISYKSPKPDRQLQITMYGFIQNYQYLLGSNICLFVFVEVLRPCQQLR